MTTCAAVLGSLPIVLGAGAGAERHRPLGTAVVGGLGNLWIFGATFSLFSSNKTLQRQVEDVLGKKHSGTNAGRQPDLTRT